MSDGTIIIRLLNEYVMNNPSMHTPSADTIFRRIHGIASESGSHRRKGSGELKRKTVNSGIDTISDLIGLTVRTVVSMDVFMQPVNVAIDEHEIVLEVLIHKVEIILVWIYL